MYIISVTGKHVFIREIINTEMYGKLSMKEKEIRLRVIMLMNGYLEKLIT